MRNLPCAPEPIARFHSWAFIKGPRGTAGTTNGLRLALVAGVDDVDRGFEPELSTAPKKEADVLSWALMFLLIAIVAAVFGFGGIAGAAAGFAKILFFVFLVLFLVSLIRGGAGRTV